MESKLKCVFDVDPEMLQVCYIICQHPIQTLKLMFWNEKHISYLKSTYQVQKYFVKCIGIHCDHVHCKVFCVFFHSKDLNILSQVKILTLLTSYLPTITLYVPFHFSNSTAFNWLNSTIGCMVILKHTLQKCSCMSLMGVALEKAEDAIWGSFHK